MLVRDIQALSVFPYRVPWVVVVLRILNKDCPSRFLIVSGVLRRSILAVVQEVVVLLAHRVVELLLRAEASHARVRTSHHKAHADVRMLGYLSIL